MSIIKDAFNEIMPKKKDKDSSQTVVQQPQQKSDLERLHELKSEIEQKIEAVKPKEPEKLPEIEVPMETKVQVLEHNMLAVMNEFDDRVRAIEQFLIRNYNQEREK